MTLIAFAFLGGCTGGGSSSGGSTSGDSSASALKIAEKISVVETQQSASKVAALKIGKLYLNPSEIPQDSDYFKAHQRIFVHDPSAEPFDIINEILCIVAQTQYEAMLNKGAYIAQIDRNLCRMDRDSASNAGEQSQNQSSGSTMPDYEMWTIESSRADNNSPHIVKVWASLEADEHTPERALFAKLSMTEGASNTNPYGIFTLNFKMHPIINGNMDTSKVVDRGFLKTEKDSSGKVLLKFALKGGGGNETWTMNAVLDRASDGSNGSGRTRFAFTHPGGSDSGEYNLVYNDTHFRRQNINTNDDKCFSRTQFDESAWSYGLYDSTGNRVKISSGFPVRKGDRHGWIGYYGMWFPDDVSLNDGDTVYKFAFGPGGAEEQYTVFKKRGKLIKYTKKELTLTEIKDIPLQYHGSTDNSEYRAVWNGTNFMKIDKLDCQGGPCYWADITDVAMNLSSLQWDTLHFWSEALGGEVRIKLAGCTNNMGSFNCSNAATNNQTKVTFYLQETVYPTDTVASTLSCAKDCPNPSTLNDNDSSNDYFNNNMQPSQNPTFNNYSFSTEDMLLKYNNVDIIKTSSGDWGLRSGPLFEDTQENRNLLKCEWDQSLICPWRVWDSLNTFYIWETGPNSWNQFITLKSGNSFLKFDPPLSVALTHNNAKYYLEYSGFGNLWGIPGKCVDENTGSNAACGPNTRWIPEFSIPDGTELTDGSDSNIKYLAKAIEKEQRMKNVDNSYCSSINYGSYTLPTIDTYEDPNIGDEPVVMGAPAVIGGVLQ